MTSVEWGEFRIGDLFEIQNTLSFNKDLLTEGREYDYITRTSQNQGILQETGFVNEENINSAGNWSLGLLQMDFFYREKPWYAGQFVRKITPKIYLSRNSILYFTVVLNKQKQSLLSVLVRDVDKKFLSTKIKLPILNDGSINYDFMDSFISDFMDSFISELEQERVVELKAYLSITGLDNYLLTDEEQVVLGRFEKGDIVFSGFPYKSIFNNIKQGRRLKKDDQLQGDIPFVMAGTTNTGVVNYISNPVALFPSNSITVDIFGNSFYRSYDFGAGDDTGVYWSNNRIYAKETMLFLTTAVAKSLYGKFDFGNKLRSSQSLDFVMQLPSNNEQPDFTLMNTLISAIQKLVIKDVVLYANREIEATKIAVDRKSCI